MSLPVMSDGRVASADEATPVLSLRIAELSIEKLEELSDMLSGGGETTDEMRSWLSENFAYLFDGTSKDCYDLVNSGRWFRQTGGTSWGDDPTDSFTPLLVYEQSGITVEPIDGGPLVPAPLRRALKAYVKFVGEKLDVNAGKAAAKAWGASSYAVAV